MNTSLGTLLLLCCIALTACGYSLRGNDSLPAALGNIQLHTQNPNSEFSRLMARSLGNAGFVSSEALATGENHANNPVLTISEPRIENQAVSVNPAARAAQYLLRLSVDIMLSQGQTELITIETLSVERSYFEDIENIAGNQEEVTIISNEMRRDLVNQIIRRVEASF